MLNSSIRCVLEVVRVFVCGEKIHLDSKAVEKYHLLAYFRHNGLYVFDIIVNNVHPLLGLITRHLRIDYFWYSSTNTLFICVFVLVHFPTIDLFHAKQFAEFTRTQVNIFFQIRPVKEWIYIKIKPVLNVCCTTSSRD